MPPPSPTQVDFYLNEGTVPDETSGADPVLQAYYAAQLFPLSYRSVSDTRIPLPRWNRYCQDAPNPVRLAEWRNIIITARISLCEEGHDLLADPSVVPRREQGDDDCGKGYVLMEKLVGFHGKARGSTKNRQLITYVENHPGKGRGCGTVFYPFLEFDRECDYKAAVEFITTRIRHELLGRMSVFELAEQPSLVHDKVMLFLASKGIEPPPPPVEEPPPEPEPEPPPKKKKK